MERKRRWNVTSNLGVWLALLSLFIAHHASSKPEKHIARQLSDDNNPGFISIDCGSDVDYLHEETGIWYQTDKNFVETGMNHVVPPRINLNYDYFGRQLTTLRSFPDGDRNCYTLKPKQGKNNSYLIRAFFAYGNYDFKNETPSFDLYIGVNYWDTIGFIDYYYFTDIIHTPLTDIIHVCLIKTGPTIPFISSLELRLLNSSIYQIPIMSSSTPQPQLKLETRLNFGAPSYPLHNRYKDDVYDRMWRCYKEVDNRSWTPLFLDESMDTKPTTKVGAILDIKSTYHISKLTWQGDPCVPKQYAWEGLNCSSDTNPRITSLNLSSSNLAGVISTSFSYLTELEFLDLSDNELEGPLPEFLAKLTNLKTLNIGGNKLSGSIPAKLIERSRNGSLTLRVDGNPYLCTSSPCHKRSKIVIRLIVILVGAFILSAVLVFIFRRLQVAIRINKSSSNKINRGDSNKQEFTYSEVLSITNNFERVLGKGGFGTVYHGCVGETQVAVKMLSHSSQGFQQFLTEAKILTIVHHKCLTPLIGYCNEGTALIYKYMPNGNLAKHLSDKNQISLGWKQRLQIALDSAVGLEYLHNGCTPQIVHRDVKTSNILLDEDFRGKISDFGYQESFQMNVTLMCQQ